MAYRVFEALNKIINLNRWSCMFSAGNSLDVFYPLRAPYIIETDMPNAPLHLTAA